MRFPPHLLDDIRARLPISQVVGRRVAWDKRKSNPGRGDFWACCPFHGEKTPSFHAEDRKGRYHCFGCGVSGDHFTFLVEQEGLSFPEAVAQLAAEAGVALPERGADDRRMEAQRASLHDVMERAARFFEAALQAPEGGKARAYLRERAIAPDLQARFRIGYAPPGRNALKAHLADAGVDQAQMVEAGLLIAGDDIPVSFDRFRDRVMFPITDGRGRIIAFGGRALAADARAKYLNSPETPLFSKGRVLYNGQAARAALRRGGSVLAVEGYVDVIACVGAGFEAAVAPLGTALTEDQLRLLWQMADEPILCFDGDAAGLKAAFRAIDVALPLLQPGKSLGFALLPEGRDPDDLIRAEGADAFRKLLAAARPLIDMLWARESRGIDLATPERRAGLEQALRKAVASISDSGVRRYYELAVRERTDAQFRPAFRRRTNFPARSPGRRDRPADMGGQPSSSLLSSALVRDRGAGGQGPSLGDAVLLGVLLLHPQIAAARLELLAQAQFSAGASRDLAAALAAAVAENPDLTAADLAARMARTGQGAAMAAVLEKLERMGLGGLAAAPAEQAATVWDDAHHLRLRAGALSIERQAAAQALGRETSDIHLIRLRDIQEQDQRNLRPDQRGEAEDAGVVHPFKRL